MGLSRRKCSRFRKSICKALGIDDRTYNKDGYDDLLKFSEKPDNYMPGMYKIPHMDGTHGHVPDPGEPVWQQRNY